jgi:hypothetical protein
MVNHLETMSVQNIKLELIKSKKELEEATDRISDINREL